jgi:hypothetical protein
VLVLAQAWFILNLTSQQRAHAAASGSDRSLPVGSPAGAGLSTGARAPEQGLPVGTTAPEFQLTGLFGETLTLAALRSAGLFGISPHMWWDSRPRIDAFTRTPATDWMNCY